MRHWDRSRPRSRRGPSRNRWRSKAAGPGTPRRCLLDKGWLLPGEREAHSSPGPPPLADSDDGTVSFRDQYSADHKGPRDGAATTCLQALATTGRSRLTAYTDHGILLAVLQRTGGGHTHFWLPGTPVPGQFIPCSSTATNPFHRRVGGNPPREWKHARGRRRSVRRRVRRQDMNWQKDRIG